MVFADPNAPAYPYPHPFWDIDWGGERVYTGEYVGPQHWSWKHRFDQAPLVGWTDYGPTWCVYVESESSVSANLLYAPAALTASVLSASTMTARARELPGDIKATILCSSVMDAAANASHSLTASILCNSYMTGKWEWEEYVSFLSRSIMTGNLYHDASMKAVVLANGILTGNLYHDASMKAVVLANGILTANLYHKAGAKASVLSASSLTANLADLVTPSGGCGSLPKTLVTHFSSFSTAYSWLNGNAITITYSSAKGTWTGSGTFSSHTESVTLECFGGHWEVICGGAGSNGSGTAMSGTSGANPSLTASVTLNGSLGTGTGTVTIKSS